MSFRRTVLVFIGILLLLCGILSWRLWIYKANVSFSAAAPFTLTMHRDQERTGITLNCPLSPCTLRLTPDQYTANVTAPGFVELEEPLAISWRGHNAIQFALTPLPAMAHLTTAPESWQQMASKAQAAQQKFLLKENGQLFLQDATNAILIADFPATAISSFRLFPGENNRLYLLSPAALYEVDTAEKRKYQLLTAEAGQTFSGLQVLQKNTLVVSIQEKAGISRLTLFFPETRISQPLKNVEGIALDLTCENPAAPGELFFLVPFGDTSWELQKFNTADMNATPQNIINASISTNPEQIRCESPQSIVVKAGTEFLRLTF